MPPGALVRSPTRQEYHLLLELAIAIPITAKTTFVAIYVFDLVTKLSIVVDIVRHTREWLSFE
jgi:hypothetical protein